MNLGNILREERESLRFTQADVAEKLLFTRQTISNWELGKSYPDLESLVKLSNFYNISLDILLKEDQKIVQAVKKKNTFKFKILISLLIVIIIFILLSFKTYTFSKQINIVSLSTQNVIVKKSWFGKGNTLYFINADGKMIYSKKVRAGHIEIIGEDDLIPVNTNF